MGSTIQDVLDGRERWALIHGDNRELLPTLPADSVDSVATDPPYELGFMGKEWDGTGIAYSPDFWREVLRVLKPGGHLLAFSGSRTSHRMVCAIEDAGFEVRDSVQWWYGTGFPKSLNIGDGRGTALKPAHEPICLARKPLIGTVAANVRAYGTGGLNIDACRIDGRERSRYGLKNSKRTQGAVYGSPTATADFDATKGRWPANVILDESAAAELDAQTEGRLHSAGKARPAKREATGAGLFGIAGGDGHRLGDSGGASRFFYVAKPSRAERDLGCEHLSEKSGGEATDREDDSAGLTPRAGAGRTGGARNHHPTVKPIALMRYLVRLITPPGGVVLDPFMGSGSTGVGALLEGFRFVGLEREAEYLEIARARIERASAEPREETERQLGLL